MALKHPSSSKGKYKFSPPETKKNNWNLAGVFVIIVIVAAGLFLVFGQRQALPGGLNVNVNVSAPNSSNNTTAADANCGDLCWLNKGVEQKSAYACGQIANQSAAQECYEKVAPYSIEACIEVMDYQKKKECVVSNAVAQKSIAFCNNLNESDRKGCISAADPCYFKSGGERNLCRAVSEKNYTYCGNDEACILSFVSSTSLVDACGLLKIPAKQFACVSLAKGDSCKDMQYPSERDQCFDVLATWTNQSYLCDKINPETVYAVECYQYFAIQERKKSYCSAHLQFNNLWSCYTNYSIGANDVSGCVAIDVNAKFSKVKCFTDFAMINRDPAACALMDDPSDKVRCYYESIFLADAAPIPRQNCANITSNTWKDKCYSYSAVGNKDVSTCAYIEDDSAMQLCLSKFK